MRRLPGQGRSKSRAHRPRAAVALPDPEGRLPAVRKGSRQSFQIMPWNSNKLIIDVTQRLTIYLKKEYFAPNGAIIIFWPSCYKHFAPDGANAITMYNAGHTGLPGETAYLRRIYRSSKGAAYLCKIRRSPR